VLPLAGGLLFAVLIGVRYTSELWLYRSTPAAAARPAKASPIPANAHASAGRGVFSDAGCGSCHALDAAGAGGMPSFAGRLSPQEIRDVAAFVAANTG
jgi:mono/diheme cytochrome c family protein